MRMVIDFGHGGTDSGAIGGTVYEKNINKLVGERVVYHLKRHGQTPILTRNNDDTVSLDERVNIINRNVCDIGVSIHCNAFNGTARGLETWTWGTGSRELLLAKKVHGEIKKTNLYHSDRGIKQEQWRVLSPQIPMCLVELGFIDNEQDRKLLLDNIENYAVAITRGLLGFYEIVYKEEKPTTKETWYNVNVGIVGGYKDENDAKRRVQQLADLGIKSTIEKVLK